MTEKKASKRADEKTKGETYQQFRTLYERFLYDLYQLQEDTTHEQVTDAIDEFMSDKHGLKKSIKMALRKNKYLQESYLNRYDDDEDEDEDEVPRGRQRGGRELIPLCWGIPSML